MSLASAFAAAWKDMKKVATTVETFIVKQQPVIQNVETTVTAAVSTISPAAGAGLTAFDALEEAIVGKIAALANDTATAPTVQQLFAEDWPVIQQLVAALKTAPAVIEAAKPAA